MLIFRLPSFISSHITFSNHNDLVKQSGSIKMMFTSIDKQKFNELDKYRKYTYPYECMNDIVCGNNYTNETYSTWEILSYFDILKNQSRVVYISNNVDPIHHLIQQHHDINISHILTDDMAQFIYMCSEYTNNTKKFREWFDEKNGIYDIIIAFPKYNSEHNVINTLAMSIITQDVGGSLIIELPDIKSTLSIDILYILSSLYEDVFIVNPEISDKYKSNQLIYCYGLIKNVSFDFILNMMHLIGNPPHCSRIINNYIPYTILSTISNAASISENIMIIEMNDSIRMVHNKFNPMVDINKRNISKCIKWCTKYKIQYK